MKSGRIYFILYVVGLQQVNKPNKYTDTYQVSRYKLKIKHVSGHISTYPELVSISTHLEYYVKEWQSFGVNTMLTFE